MKATLVIQRIWLFFVLSIIVAGCGPVGGGSSDSNTVSTSSVQVLPSDYDFGMVTLGNTPVPLEVKIKNIGSANLNVYDIILSDTNNFILNLGGGESPCSTKAPSIGVGKICTVEVTFDPQFAAVFNATLQIKSNGNNNPTANIQLIGAADLISSLYVKINQIESNLQCPAAKVSAYVSVIDQGGYAVTGLSENNFTVIENINLMTLTDFSFVAQVLAPISVALVMDYSGSITVIPEAKSDMEHSVIDFVNQLGADDEAEIVKFATQVEVVQGFTSDKNLLINAIYNTVDTGEYTSLYAAASQAVDDTALRQKPRRAVIVITDGVNSNSPYSTILSDVINNANDKGIPIFTVGLGSINEAVLEQMSNDTGGQFFNSPASDNLRNIYNQLADILFENQYILEYESVLGVGETADLTIEALLQTFMGDDIKEITPCP